MEVKNTPASSDLTGWQGAGDLNSPGPNSQIYSSVNQFILTSLVHFSVEITKLALNKPVLILEAV